MGLYLNKHPEILFFQEEVKNYGFADWVSSFFSIILNNEITENLLSPVFLFAHCVFIIYVVAFFSVFTFSFFGSYSSEENLIDHDYLISTVLVESEEEIGSLDDMTIAGIIFFFIFGWFFYYNVFLVLT